MRGERLLVSVLLLGLMLGLLGGLSMAQGTESESSESTSLGTGVAPQAMVGIAFTYQGRLNKGGTPYDGTCDFHISLYDALTEGNQVGSTQNIGSMEVKDGLFTVLLNAGNEFGDGAFTGERRWLAIEVQCTGDGSYTSLEPRQELTPAPYALALPGLRTEQNTYSPNVIGGYSGNWVTAGAYGASIGGGGESSWANRITDRWGTVGGGKANRAGDSTGDVNDAMYATVGGGSNNKASGESATVGGGAANDASGISATVAGGSSNYASNLHATIGGGHVNDASGRGATVPGGIRNDASGAVSFAAGARAQANHDGTFVWADCGDYCSQPFNGTPFASTDANQFLVRAGGGVGIGTNSPQADLHVAGDSTGERPHVTISETGTDDYARLRFTNANQDAYWGVVAGGANNQLNFYRSGSGNIMQMKPSDATDLLLMSNGARLTAGGAWTNASDRQLKADLAPVDAADVLHRVSVLPIATWRYTVEPESVRHIGPSAQDFFAAFGLGSDDRVITTIDADGVALAAIQGLYEQNEALAEENATLQEQIDDLEARLAALESRVGGGPSSSWRGGLLLPGSGLLVVGLGVVWVGRRKCGGGR